MIAVCLYQSKAPVMKIGTGKREKKSTKENEVQKVINANTTDPPFLSVGGKKKETHSFVAKT